jgi:membrane associated rhomboid family serine protease
MNLQDFPARLNAVSPNEWLARTLVGLMALVFAVTVLLGGGLLQADGRVHVALGSNYGSFILAGQWWRLLAAQFLHFGLIHIGFNAMALWQVGPLAERLFGRWHFLLLFLLAGIGGGFGTLIWHPQVNSAGASGAIFGLIGGLLAFVSRRDLGVPLALVNNLRRSFLSFGGFSLAAGFLLPGVDNAAHVGGLVTGFVLGLVLARPVDVAARQGADLPRLIAVTAGALVCFIWLGSRLQA